ncbi:MULTISPECIES: hypothetical protein [Bacillus]|uniref:Uncharacterized protein n=1 Tax=Bacillus mycoides TaxID=1405 RepID=A0A3D9UI80_BACMY|nr:MULTISPECIES: hypothetical protein [Bacillus]MBK5503384.1 hypothetical protein [Bacillus sp. TH12]QWI78041.1 hypothetical protein JG486_28410 [Bacillus mycoides]RBP25841.1 hypothetical protein DET63_109118 [Bacillus sp. DB-2]REF29007.1 hypothetical protein DET55_12127 [Bacillus mycoides]
MKRFNHNLDIKKLTGIALASAIGFSGLGVLGTSVSAAENTNYVTVNQGIKAEDMSMRQLQDAVQQKNDPFINQVKIFINKHFQESEFLWGKVSKQLKIDIVDLLVGNEKDYSKKVDAGLKNHFKEVPALLKLASPGFVKDLIKLLDYLPE